MSKGGVRSVNNEQWGGIRLKMGSGWKMSGCAPRYRVQGRVIGVYFDYAQGKQVSGVGILLLEGRVEPVGHSPTGVG
jgi:hypothetical protein